MQRDQLHAGGNWCFRAALASRVTLQGVTLIELLCVMAIIGILASMLLPAVGRAYSRAKGMAEEWEAPEIFQLLLTETRGYCAGNPRFRFDSKDDFAEKCGLAPKCKDWMQAPATEFTPFGHLDPTNQVVLVFHIGRKHATRYAFDVGELSRRPPQR